MSLVWDSQSTPHTLRLKIKEVPTVKVWLPWSYIVSYDVLSCSTHWPQPTHQISLSSDETHFTHSWILIQVQSHVTQKLGEMSKIWHERIYMLQNGGGDRFWKSKNFQLPSSAGLDLDLGWGHMTYCRLPHIDLNYRPNFTDRHMDRHWDRLYLFGLCMEPYASRCVIFIFTEVHEWHFASPWLSMIVMLWNL